MRRRFPNSGSCLFRLTHPSELVPAPWRAGSRATHHPCALVQHQSTPECKQGGRNLAPRVRSFPVLDAWQRRLSASKRRKALPNVHTLQLTPAFALAMAWQAAASTVSMGDQQPRSLVSTLPAHITARHMPRCLTRTRPPEEVLLVRSAEPRG